MAERERLWRRDGCEALRAEVFHVRRSASAPRRPRGSPRDLDGVTEVRAGVFMFFDLVMAGIGVCRIDDIALSVLATVIGHQQDKGWTIVDAGWMAMSRDRGTARLAVDQGYGLVCDLAGEPIPDLIMIDANQEHGILAARPGAQPSPPKLPVGARLRILPNHACATARNMTATTSSTTLGPCPPSGPVSMAGDLMSNSIKRITTKAPQPFGHYAQATEVRALSTSPANSRRAPMGRHSRPPVRGAGPSGARQRARDRRGSRSRPRSHARVTAYLVGVEHWPAFNAIYAEVLGDHRPARAVVPVPALITAT